MSSLAHLGGTLYRDDAGVLWSFANPYRPVMTWRPGDRYIPEPVRPGMGVQPAASRERVNAAMLRRLREANAGRILSSKVGPLPLGHPH